MKEMRINEWNKEKWGEMRDALIVMNGDEDDWDEGDMWGKWWGGGGWRGTGMGKEKNYGKGRWRGAGEDKKGKKKKREVGRRKKKGGRWRKDGGVKKKKKET